MSKISSIIFEDNPIYKVNHLINNEINKIYVFYGKKETKDEKILFKKIFTEKEIENIEKNRIDVIIIEQKIHLDDSIGTIKIKILNEIKDISIEEIYLFCEKKETLNSISVYESLTQNKKISLTNIRLEQFISNIVGDEFENEFIKPNLKETYDYDDILELGLDNKKYIIEKVLGQKFFLIENEYPFVCNPFKVESYDSFFEKTSRKSLSTLNNQLLLNNGSIVDNNIYLCLAEDVLKYVSEKDISEENTLKIYFPFLYNLNINTLDDLYESKDKLIEENKKFLIEKTFDLFKTINMLYDIYYFEC